MTSLTLDAVTKRFTEGDAELLAVDEVSMEIDDGEFLVIVGPSGCGKTTTLRMIAGLESISQGEIRLGERVINDQPPQRRDIAMVFQSYALYPHMTVGGNMRFGLEESTGMTASEITDRVEETASMLGIESLLKRKPAELSGGQQQRVALGRAIVRDPEIFLLDEPLANLDAKLRAQMRIELQRLQEDLATTTIYVTHDQTEAMTMGDRIAILNDGKLQQIGTPTECYHEPANVFVASFIGEPSMNTLRATVDDGLLETDHFSYRISSDLESQLTDTDEIILGIRPNDIDLVESATQENDFECVVEVVEPVGRENFVYLKPSTGADQSLIAIVPGTHQINENQTVTARVSEHAFHVFDAETGSAIRNRLFSETEREPWQQTS